MRIRHEELAKEWSVLDVFVLVCALTAAAQTDKWSYFKFRPSQYAKYEMKSQRGLKGWLSVKVEDAGSGVLSLTVAGKWTSEFSETTKIKPGKSSVDVVYSFKNVDVTNAADSLLNVDSIVVDNTSLKNGFKWSQGDKSIEVVGEKNAGGIKGLVVTYSSKLFGQLQKRTYCINSGFPLPVFAEVPAANDTWTYELVEQKGF